MTYKVEGIDKVFWKYSKSIMDYNSSEELIQQLNDKIVEYLGHNFGAPYSEHQIAQLVISAFAHYSQSGLIRPYDITELFKVIISDPILEQFYAKDDRSTNVKVIVAILSFFRNQQVRLFDGTVLVDFGQNAND